MNAINLILILAIISGQLIKLPLPVLGGVTMLDIVVFAFCLLGLTKIWFKFKKPPLFIFGGLMFIFIAILSLLLTPLNLIPLEFVTSFLYTVRFAIYIFFGLLIFSGAFPFLNKKQILIASGVGLAILGLIQFIFLPDLRFLANIDLDPHFYRTVSTFLDPNFAGAYFVLTLILIVNEYMTLTLKSYKKNLLFLTIYLALLTTFSRSSYLMFLVSFLISSFLRKSVKMAFLTIVLFIFLIISFRISTQIVNRVISLDRNQTASYRLSTWQQGLKIFSRNPVLGVGFNAYNFALRHYRLGNEQFLRGKGSTTNDSSLLYILSTTGALGLLAYSLFIFGMIKISKINMAPIIFGLLTHSFFVNSLFYPFTIVWLILITTAYYDKPSIK